MWNFLWNWLDVYEGILVVQVIDIGEYLGKEFVVNVMRVRF